MYYHNSNILIYVCKDKEILEIKTRFCSKKREKKDLKRNKITHQLLKHLTTYSNKWRVSKINNYLIQSSKLSGGEKRSSKFYSYLIQKTLFFFILMDYLISRGKINLKKRIKNPQNS